MAQWTMRNPWRGIPTRPRQFVPMDGFPDTRRLNPEEELLVREELRELLTNDGGKMAQVYRAMERAGIALEGDDPLVVLTEKLAAQR